MKHAFSLIKLITASALVVTTSSVASADQYNSSAIGIIVNGGNRTFSTGIQMSSPWFLNNSLAVQAAVMKSWFTQSVNSETGDEEWAPYQSYKLGLMGGSTTVGGFMRMYGAGGLLYIDANEDISEIKSITGSYGTFGFEFFSGRNLNYFIELGANGINAKANAVKLPSKPIYSNGYSSTVGFKYYL